MAAPKGNRFWEMRSSHGASPKFAGPDELWLACVEYFNWVASTPLLEERLVSFQGITKRENVKKMRAMTLAGLTTFLDVETNTWVVWRRDRNDLKAVIAKVEKIIYDQKFTGAAADMLNANIIARDLGLADKSELTGKDGAAIQIEDATNDARAFASRMAGLAARSLPEEGTGEA
jgi:hypothetical protein